MSARYRASLMASTRAASTTTSAPGIWRLNDQLVAKYGNTWPSYIAPDPYFNYVSLLLPGNGSNGATNNAYLDTSSNAYAITSNGSGSVQGAVSPFGVDWSAYLAGSGNYLSLPGNTAYQVGSGDFTMECWVNYSVLPTSGLAAFGGVWNSNTNYSYLFVFTANGTPRLQAYYAPSGTTVTGNDIANWTPTIGVWYHVAFVRASGTLIVYINGTSVGSIPWNVTPYNSSTIFTVGSAGNDGHNITGYISNFRLVKGTAVYTANFTPSTVPLTAITNTSLLTCQNNRYVDNSSNNATVTAVGSVALASFGPFGSPTPYSATTTGGSYYSTGGGTTLTATTGGLAVGTGDFTVEMWVRFSSLGATEVFACTRNTGGFQIVHRGVDWTFDPNSSSVIATASGVFQYANVWYHIAVSRQSGTIRLFTNGVLNATVTGNTTNFNQSGFCLAALNSDTSYNVTGSIAGFRFTNTAVYTASFSPSTSPPTAITGTQLLLNMTNAGVIDTAIQNNMALFGSAQISTAQSKYGGSSISMVNTGDYARGIQNNLATDISNADFTIEFWVYFTSLSADRALISKYGPTAENDGGYGYLVQWMATGTLRLVLGVSPPTDNVYSFAWSPSISTWYHVAVTRQGTSGRAFVNGTQIGSTTTVIANNSVSPNAIQIGKTHTVAQYLLGYMSDVRITRGLARYTANFTPPTAALPTFGP